MAWKFCGKAQFPHSFGRFAWNYAETVFSQNFRTRKLGEITVFYAVQLEEDYLKSYDSNQVIETSPLCEVCQIKETPSHYLLEWNKFKKEREALQNNISPSSAQK